MGASGLALLAIRVSVLGIFAPTSVTVEAAGRTHALALRDGALVVDGAPRDRFRSDPAPAVTVAVLDGRGRPRIVRRFRGAIEARASGGAISLVDDLPVEDYLPGTVALETHGDHPEALRAQAVVARTFAARGSRHARAGFDLCDLTHCQTYRGLDGETEAARAAVAATAGQVLTVAGKVAEVYFTATCGGATADAADVWPDGGPRAHLRSVPCDACRESPDRAWRADVRIADLKRALDPEILGDESPTGVTVVERGAGGVVRSVRLDGTGASMTGEQLRVLLGRALGWSVVKSNRFTVSKRLDGQALRFEGRGFGHGVGLCESGAAELAKRGASWREILARYFPGATPARR